MTRDATQGAPRRFPDGPKMVFQPSKMAKIEREPTQDELTQDEGEYFSMGEGKGEGKQRCSNTPQDPRRGRRIMCNLSGAYIVMFSEYYFV